MWKSKIERVCPPITNDKFKEILTKYHIPYIIDYVNGYIYKPKNEQELRATFFCHSKKEIHFIKPFNADTDYDIYQLYKTIDYTRLNDFDQQLCYLQYVLILKYMNEQYGFIHGDSHGGNIIIVPTTSPYSFSLCGYKFEVNYVVKIIDLDVAKINDIETKGTANLCVDMVYMLLDLSRGNNKLTNLYEEIKEETQYECMRNINACLHFDIDEFIQQVFDVTF